MVGRRSPPSVKLQRARLGHARCLGGSCPHRPRLRPRHVRADHLLHPALDRHRSGHGRGHRRRRRIEHHGAGVLVGQTAPRIWFNETYRGTYQLIGLLRSAHTVTIIGSHPVASTPYLQVCDEVIPEPDCTGEAFVAAALEICRTHRIDVFVAGRESQAVAAALPDFSAAGVRVQVSSAEAIGSLAAKGSSYELAAKLGVEIPAYELVEDIAGYREACRRLGLAGLPICIKPDLDHGGRGFRVLDDSAQSLASLGEPPSVRVAPQVVDLLLSSIESFDPLVVTEFLPGLELSIDCLSSPDGELLLALPRRKGGLEWTRELVADAAAQEIARVMVEGCGLRYLSNVQVKYALDETRGPVLLEVNTRAASGLYQSCRASGVNLPALALALTLGESVTVPEPTYGQTMIVYNEAIPHQSR
jgi:hypothetical protein